MSIEKTNGQYVLACDVCGDAIRYDTFSEAVLGCKDQGWMKRKTEDGWENVCDECLGYEGDSE